MAELQKTLGGTQLFSIGFGSIVGVGWIVVMGLWFEQAGPGGTAVAFLLGGLLLALIGLCYAEMSAMFPVAGGEVAYAGAAFGPPFGFVVGWALTLMTIAVVPYVSIAMGWLLDALMPGFAGPVLYRWRGAPVHAVSLAVSLTWTVTVGWLNYRGIQTAARVQDTLTYGKIIVSLVFIGAGLWFGRATNLSPAFHAPPGRSVLGGMITVLAMTPWFFGGFNFVPQVMEEKAPGTPATMVGRALVAALLIAGVYYAALALATGMAGPWQRIVGENLPTAAAFRLGFESELLGRLVLITGLCGIVTTSNGASITSSRLLFALSRGRMITPTFERLHPVHRSPAAAIVFGSVLGFFGNFLGRNGIAPIINVGSTCAALAYLVTCAATLRLRRRQPDRPRPFRIRAGSLVAVLGAFGSGILLVSSLRQHWTDANGGFPLEWGVLLIWSALGAALWHQARAARAGQLKAERPPAASTAG